MGMSKNKSRILLPFYGLLAILIVLFGIVIGLTPLQAPDRDKAKPSEVSFESTWGFLENIAQKPHPVGSEEHEKVKNYLIQTIEKMGLDVEVQDTIVHKPEMERATRVQNIVTKMEGSDSSGTVMLAAHYDSTFVSPGASDDGYGVAALLETARILKDMPLKNDVIILITDGEELGLLGAHAFVNEHPWAKDVDVVLNFEARGIKGATFMFETSGGNGALIKEFQKATSSPASNSFLKEVYDVMPNGTDLTEFVGAGMQGLNFASAQSFNSYHTTIDRLDFVDKNTLMHHTTYAYELATHFGNIDLSTIDNQPEKNAVYFNPVAHTFVSYSDSLVIPLLIVTFIGLMATVIHGIRRKLVSVLGALIGFLLFIVSLAIAYGISLCALKLVTFFAEDVSWLLEFDQHIASIYLIGFLLITTAVLILFTYVVQKKIGAFQVVMGALIGWFLLACVSSVLLTGASYLFVWPLIFSLIGTNLVFWRDKKFSTENNLLLYSAFLVPGIVLFTFLVFSVYIALTITVIHIVMTVAALSLMLFVPVFARLQGSWKYAIALLLLGISIVTYETIAVEATSEHPIGNQVYYMADGDLEKAIWGIQTKPDSFTKQFVADESEFDDHPLPSFTYGEMYTAEAPYYDTNLPQSEFISDVTKDGWRTIILEIAAPNAIAIELGTNSDISMNELSINGEELQLDEKHYSKENPYFIELFGLSKGFTMTFTIKEGESLDFYLIGKTFELPEEHAYTKRPSNMTTHGDYNMVLKTFRY